MASNPTTPEVILSRQPMSEKRLVKAIDRLAGPPPAAEGWLCHELSPGEWFMVETDRAAVPTRDGAATTTPGDDLAARYLTVDAGAAWECWRIAGPKARALAAKGTAVDLDPSVLEPGTWRSCRFGPYRAHLHLVSETTIDLYVERSLATPAEDLLCELGAEFQIAGELRKETVA